MGKIKLTIQHNGAIYEPPVESGVKIDWERKGTPGKMTFTVVNSGENKTPLSEGDRVSFYYDGKLVFVGYIFTKKHSKENLVSVTCYDQIRYLKNKFTYVFENKTANQIIQALCNDFSLKTGGMDNTGYVIPVVAEENKAALDIILGVLEDTLLNTGNMFVLYDDAGSIMVKNCANMVSKTLIMENTAEDFDYSSSIDNETYNNIILYYKEDEQKITLYTASSEDRTKQWGVLQYFEEVKNKTTAQNKANTLLKNYCKKTRELKITGAFGDITVRGGTLIPIKLKLDDVEISNNMLVESVTHNFEENLYTMDLTVGGTWEDDDKLGNVVSKTIGDTSSSSGSSSGGSTSSSGLGGSSGSSSSNNYGSGVTKTNIIARIQVTGSKDLAGNVSFHWTDSDSQRHSSISSANSTNDIDITNYKSFEVNIAPKLNYSYEIVYMSDGWTRSNIKGADKYYATGSSSCELIIKWVR